MDCPILVSISIPPWLETIVHQSFVCCSKMSSVSLEAGYGVRDFVPHTFTFTRTVTSIGCKMLCCRAGNGLRFDKLVADLSNAGVEAKA
jgi:hypothetical protein